MPSVATGVQHASTPQAKSNDCISISFLIADWTANAGQYELDLQHNLESLDVSIELYENEVDRVFVSTLKIINTNTVRLFTAINPDCRFDGKAIILAI